MTDRICHRQHGQSESQRNAKKGDAEIGKASGEHCRAAAAKHQPEGAEELGGNPPSGIATHRSPLLARRQVRLQLSQGMSLGEYPAIAARSLNASRSCASVHRIAATRGTAQLRAPSRN